MRSLTFEVHGVDAPVQVQLTCHLLVACHGDDGAAWAVRGQQLGGPATPHRPSAQVRVWAVNTGRARPRRQVDMWFRDNSLSIIFNILSKHRPVNQDCVQPAALEASRRNLIRLPTLNGRPSGKWCLHRGWPFAIKRTALIG